MNKTLDYYLALPYAIEIKCAESGYWVGKIPILNGCEVRHENRETVLQLLDDAKRRWLEAALAQGIMIPEPRIICE